MLHICKFCVFKSTIFPQYTWGGCIYTKCVQPGMAVHTPAVPALIRLRQENHCKFEVTLGYKVSSRTA